MNNDNSIKIKIDQFHTYLRIQLSDQAANKLDSRLKQKVFNQLYDELNLLRSLMMWLGDEIK